LRAISGIYPLEQGSIRFDGAPIHGQPAHRIVQSGLSHAPEGRQIFSSMTVRRTCNWAPERSGPAAGAGLCA
jgi:branched-chain amino acid transport system ATP-binding protein